MATEYPSSAKPAAVPPAPAPAPQSGSDGEAPTEASPSEPAGQPAQAPARRSWPSSLGRTGDDVASVILGLLLWGWVVRPYLAGGTEGIKNLLRAKFLNQAKDGSQLP